MWIIGLCVSALLMVHGVQTQRIRPRDRYDKNYVADFPSLWHNSDEKYGEEPSNPLEGISTDDPKVQQLIVNLTNQCRKTVQPTASNMLEAVWNKLAAENAKKWANTCACKHSSSAFRELEDFGCGENLFMASYAASWEEAINGFCDEKVDFIYGEGARKPTDKVGHYTQLVWYSSSQVGCWVSYCPNAEYLYFYVCQYCPAGNVNSINLPYKSGPNCAECPNDCKDGMCTNACLYDNKYTNCPDLKQSCPRSEHISAKCKASCRCKNKII
ncbi:cysteine-rich venom protein ophanin-like isoform X2 [Engystomops pustulosus]